MAGLNRRFTDTIPGSVRRQERFCVRRLPADGKQRRRCHRRRGCAFYVNLTGARLHRSVLPQSRFGAINAISTTPPVPVSAIAGTVRQCKPATARAARCPVQRCHGRQSRPSRGSPAQDDQGWNRRCPAGRIQERCDLPMSARILTRSICWSNHVLVKSCAGQIMCWSKLFRAR